ncbi:MAG TPA: membrane protein insertion efficiency factor YidD [Elusimicrobiota bacterium]|nr:membrane protein insertion efficiency factor YidD [Elusimicrobiota bacterium]
MKKACLFLIEGYQTLFRPAMSPRCRFLPTCSDYAHEAIDRHGVLKGVALSVWRLLKCHPLRAGGLDPVPEMTRHG